jgi:RNA polymerase sigma factor (sigma-70 family)
LSLQRHRPTLLHSVRELEQKPALAPALRPHGPVPLDVDRQLSALGLRAVEGDAAARNTLFAAFSPRLEGAVRRAQRTAMRFAADSATEPEDVAQEAFVVFAELLASWSGEGSLSAFVLSHFPWRLSTAVRAMRRPASGIALLPFGGEPVAVDTIEAEDILELIEALAAEMPGRCGAILLGRLRDGLTWNELVAQLGTPRRTIMRDWRRVRASLRETLGGS